MELIGLGGYSEEEKKELWNLLSEGQQNKLKNALPYSERAKLFKQDIKVEGKIPSAAEWKAKQNN